MINKVKKRLGTNPRIMFQLGMAFAGCALISLAANWFSTNQNSEEVFVEPLQLTQSPAAPVSSASLNPPEWQEITVQPGDVLANLFAQYGISQTSLMNMLSHVQHAKYLHALKPGHQLYIATEQSQLMQLVYEINAEKWLIVKNEFGRFQSQIASEAPDIDKIKASQLAFNIQQNAEKAIQKPPTAVQNAATKADGAASDTHLNYMGGVIHHSLYKTARLAGLTPKQISELKTIFKNKINFSRDIHTGDHFSVLLSGGKNPKIQAAEFDVGNIIYRAIAFTGDDGQTHYYSPQGSSLQQALLRSPLNYTHISSHFSLSRWQPILHFYRPHYGVDFAAPYGTPIKAAGDGTIVWLGTKNGYGRTIEIKHDDRYTTLYAHMSRYNKHLKSGDRVAQGEIIGYVGESGLATGSHLHYEIHVDGAPKDPLTVALPSAQPVPAKERARFFAKAAQMLAQLQYHQRQFNYARQGNLENKDNPA